MPDHGRRAVTLDARPQDRPRPDGSVRRAILAAFAEPRTLREAAAILRWPDDRVRSWHPHLRRAGLLRLVGWRHTAKRRLCGIYMRVEP